MQMQNTRLAALSMELYLRSKLYNTVTSSAGFDASTISDGNFTIFGETVFGADKYGGYLSQKYLVYQSKHAYWALDQPVAVHINGALVDPSDYTINYRFGYVKFNEVKTSSDVVTLDYSYNWAYIIPGWNQDTFVSPSISIEIGATRRSPLSLGGVYWQLFRFYINVFAPTEAARDDMVDSITQALMTDIPLIDYNSQYPYNKDGTKNSSFDSAAQQIGSLTLDSLPSITNNPTRQSDATERGRALIEVTYKVS